MFFCALLVFLISVHVAQAQLLLSKQYQRAATAVPVQRMNLKTTWQEQKRSDSDDRLKLIEIVLKNTGQPCAMTFSISRIISETEKSILNVNTESKVVLFSNKKPTTVLQPQTV